MLIIPKIGALATLPMFLRKEIQLQEYPIPPAAPAPRYLGNREWYHRSAGVKTKRFFSLFLIFGETLDILDFFATVFGFLCDFLDFSNALSNYCTVAWVTRPERPKGGKDVVKQARRTQSPL